MTRDDERREVAERLRSANEYSCSPDCELRYALDGSYECTGNGCAGCHRDAFDRLADLIDPGCDDGRYEGVHTARPVDRDALLELADEIEDNDVTYCVSTQYVLDSYACRIRKACGLVEGS